METRSAAKAKAKATSRADSPQNVDGVNGEGAPPPGVSSRQEPRSSMNPTSICSFRSTLSDLKMETLSTQEKICAIKTDHGEKLAVLMEARNSLLDDLDEATDVNEKSILAEKINKIDGKIKRLQQVLDMRLNPLLELLKVKNAQVMLEEDNDQRLDSGDEAVVAAADLQLEKERQQEGKAEVSRTNSNIQPSPASKTEVSTINVQPSPTSKGTDVTTPNVQPSPTSKGTDVTPPNIQPSPAPKGPVTTMRNVGGTPMRRTTAIVIPEVESDGGETVDYSDGEEDVQVDSRRQRTTAQPQEFEQTAHREQDQDNSVLNTLTKALQNVMGDRGSSLEKRLPEFNGDPSQWGNFAATFKRTTRKFRIDDSENMQRLQAVLKGEAKEAVQHMMANVSNVSKIMETLKENFGRPEYVLDFLVEKAKHCQAPDKSKPKTIVDFGTAVQALVVNIEAYKEDDYLNNRQLVTELVGKLPQIMKENWFRYLIEDTTRRSNLKCFSEWIAGEMKVARMQVKPTFLFEKKEEKSEEKRGSDRRSKRGPAVAASGVGEEKEKRRKCPACLKPGHTLPTCFLFQKKSVNDRWNIVKEKKACIGCLQVSDGNSRGHHLKDCTEAKMCSATNCQKMHHTLLHSESSSSETAPSLAQLEQTKGNDISNGVAAYIRGADGPLGVVPIKVRGPAGVRWTFALLDSGATRSYITSQLASTIGLTGETEMYTVTGMYGKKSTLPVTRVNLEVSGTYHNAKFYKLNDVKATTDLGFKPYSIDVDSLKKRWPHLRRARASTLTNAKIEVIIGEDDGFLSCHHQVLTLDEDAPVAKRTVLGWFVSGKMPNHNENGYAYHATGDDLIHNLIKEHFSVENFGVKVNSDRANQCSIEDKKAMSIMEATYKKVGQVPEIGLLYRDQDCNFPESRIQALKRLEGMERKMKKDPEFGKMYATKFDEYLEKGYIHEVMPTDNQRLWFIPHFGVTNPNKPGKLRLVFDAAAKSHGVSLNDNLLTGPDLIRPLTEVLWNFRRHKIVINGDIEDMFHRVQIRKEDRASQRFLWRNEDATQPPKEFEMAVLIFGATSSPSSAIFVKNKNALEYKCKFPEAYRAITEDFYVDDVLTGADTVEAAVKLFQDITMINAKGNFGVKKWTSNSAEVISAIPLDLRSQGAKDVSSKSNIPTERVLGLWWDPALDIFSFRTNFHKVKKEILEGDRPTKRQVCSLTMSLFDPIGFISHYRIKALIILQQTWRDQIGWDDEVTDEVYEDWKLWTSDLCKIESVSVPRYYAITEASKIVLHAFVDASEQAYAAVVYLVSTDGDNVSVSFLASKARVAPLKKLTIPRMELMAALLGTRLVSSIEKGLKVKISSRVFWSDSQTVLSWLTSETCRFKEFVANRVGEIQECTMPSEWRWIPTDLNVADEATRSNTKTEFDPDSRWFKGPEFLYLGIQAWPKRKKLEDGIVAAVTGEEAKINKCSNTILNLAKFSSYNRLLRSAAAVLAVINYWRKKREEKPFKRTNKGGYMSRITPEEIRLGEIIVIKEVQRCFTNEVSSLDSNNQKKNKSSALLKLSPVIDNDGILRIRGRIDKAYADDNQKRPMIIPAYHHVTSLLILEEHAKNAHQGNATVLGKLRQKFWIVGGLQTVKRVVNTCGNCRLKKLKPVIPEMGNLPHYRLASYQPPFTFTGVDFYGPMEVIVGRHREKRWGVVFVCMVTRGVHLDIAHGLSSDEMMCVLSRFLDARGRPHHIYSDNGTNFVGCAKQLHNELNRMDVETVKNCSKFQGIEWHFIPPAAPHMGGAWERMVRTVKKALWNTLKEKHPRDQTLLTAVKTVENIVNSRPLYPASDDPTDPDILTPNHFLRGHNNEGPSIPATLKDDDEFGRQQWKIAQCLAKGFWDRWTKYYLPTLLCRGKWLEKNEPIQIGDLVFIVDDQATKNVWVRGFISKVFPGEDGQVRVVEVSTRDYATKKISTYRRPVAKVCPLGLRMDSGLVAQNQGPEC